MLACTCIFWKHLGEKLFFYFVNIFSFDWPPFFIWIDFMVIILHKTAYTQFFCWLFLDSLLFFIPATLCSVLFPVVSNFCILWCYHAFFVFPTESHRWLGLHVFLCGKRFPATSSFSGDQVKHVLNFKCKIVCNVIKFWEELKTFDSKKKDLENFSLPKALMHGNKNILISLSFILYIANKSKEEKVVNIWCTCTMWYFNTYLICLDLYIFILSFLKFHFNIHYTLFSGRVQLTDWSNYTKAVSEEQG